MSDKETGGRTPPEKLKQKRYRGPKQAGKRAETGGKPKAHAEEILETLYSIMRKPRLLPGDRTRFAVCADRLDRALAMAPNRVAGRGGAGDALLLAAEAGRAAKAKPVAAPDERTGIMASIRATSPEIHEIMEGIMRKPRLLPGDWTRYKVCAYLLDRVDGKAVPDALGSDEAAGLSALLAAARRANAQRQGEAPTAAPLKAAAAEVPPQRDPRAALPDTPPAKAPISGETLPEPVHEAEAAAPEPAKPNAPPSGVPAGFAEFAARREAERKRLAGGQRPREEVFTADPPEKSMQGPLEIVQFTRGPQGTIRRV